MKSGKVITFYSYKGGVGRTLALANIAVCLAKWGYSVLCVDWDLEAPGLHLYFKGGGWAKEQSGLVDLITAFNSRRRVNWRDYARNLPEIDKNLTVMTAGKQDERYRPRMQKLRWDVLYGQKNFGAFLEKVRHEWVSSFDFVLLDSRTGINDVGGICTIQLPDIVALLFTANEQSIGGAFDVAQSAAAQRRRLRITRANIQFVPIACRFEGRVEKEISQIWLSEFARQSEPWYRQWANERVTAEQLLTYLRVPHVPYWTFGEKLPVLEEGTGPDTIGYTFETIAALFAQRLAGTDVLVSNRDTYIATARPSAPTPAPGEPAFEYDVFFSYSQADSDLAVRLINALEQKRLRTFKDPGYLVNGDQWIDVSATAMKSSKHFVLLAGDALTPWQKQSVMSFFTLTFSEQGTTRRIVPVAFPATDLSELPPILRQLHVIRINPDDVDATAQRVNRALLTAKIRSAADDPQKGKWGGDPAANGRILSAIVTRSREDDEWFEIVLRVESTDPQKPLSGNVTFHLHDTFEPQEQTVRVRGGVASLSLGAYGAFTVGAELDGGQTVLELDLAELRDAPQAFREN